MKPIHVDVQRSNVIETYPLEMGYLPDKFVRKAEEELKENSETREISIKQFKKLIQNEKSMEDVKFSHDYLIQYLRGRKYNVQKAFHVLKKFISFVRKYKTYFQPPSEEMLLINAKSKSISFLPLRDKDGCAILFIRLNRWDPSEISVDEMIRIVVLYLTYFLSDPMTQVNGFKVIFDFKCNPLKYLRFITPYYLFLIYHGTQECLPARFKAVHVLNPSIIFRIAWPIISPFLPEKLKKRLVLHESSPRLQNYFPESIIPVDYGGQLKDYDFVPYARKAKLPDCIKYVTGREHDVQT